MAGETGSVLSGRTWDEIPTPEGSAGFESHIFFRNANDGWLLIGSPPAAGSQFKEVFGTTDAGETWTRLAGALFPTVGADTNIGISAAGYVGPIVFTSDVDGWIASPRNGLLRSSDGGTNWSIALQDDNLQALQFTDTDHGWTMSLINPER